MFIYFLQKKPPGFLDGGNQNYLRDKLAESKQRQLYAARPQWLFAVYGVAIFSGLIGAIGLLLRKSWASMLLALSLAAVIVQFGYTFAVMHAAERLGAAVAIPFPLVIFLIGVALLWFARRSRARGWIAS